MRTLITTLFTLCVLILMVACGPEINQNNTVNAPKGDDTTGETKDPPKKNTPPAPLDTDNDGILDKDDHCPNLPETFNGFEDEDGCPDTKPIPAVCGDNKCETAKSETAKSCPSDCGVEWCWDEKPSASSTLNGSCDLYQGCYSPPVYQGAKSPAPMCRGAAGCEGFAIQQFCCMGSANWADSTSVEYRQCYTAAVAR